MFDDEGLFGALQCRQDHDDAQPIRGIAHHGQGKQQVGGALCRLALELEQMEFTVFQNSSWVSFLFLLVYIHENAGRVLYVNHKPSFCFTPSDSFALCVLVLH